MEHRVHDTPNGETATPDRTQLPVGVWARAESEFALAAPTLCWPSTTIRLNATPKVTRPLPGLPPTTAENPPPIGDEWLGLSVFFSRTSEETIRGEHARWMTVEAESGENSQAG